MHHKIGVHMYLGYDSILFCTGDQRCEQRYYQQTNETSETQFVYNQGSEEHFCISHWTPSKHSELEYFHISCHLTYI